MNINEMNLEIAVEVLKSVAEQRSDMWKEYREIETQMEKYQEEMARININEKNNPKHRIDQIECTLKHLLTLQEILNKKIMKWNTVKQYTLFS